MDDSVLSAFRFGTIQDCKNIHFTLDEAGIGWEEFLDWIEDRSKRIIPSTQRKIPPVPKSRLKRRCPKCKAWLHLSEVNHHPKLMVGEDFKSQWFCKHCDWVEYSNQDIETVAKPYIVEG